MKRVVVIGSGGAGKSTFAKRLGEATGLPVMHLDSFFWRPKWQPTPKREWEMLVTGLVQRDKWIMDGNFGGTRKLRIEAADTIIFLDIPRLVCMYRVIKRAVKYRGKNRPDMAAGCNEKIDLEFISWVWNFPKRSKARISDEMRPHPEKQFIVLRSSREADSFIKEARSLND